MTKTDRVGVLLVALVLECTNIFALGMPPIKGYMEGHPTQFESIRDVEQAILHLPGLLVAVGLMRLAWYFAGNSIPGYVVAVSFFLVFLCGWLETALLIVGGIYGFRGVHHLIRRSTPQKRE